MQCEVSCSALTISVSPCADEEEDDELEAKPESVKLREQLLDLMTPTPPRGREDSDDDDEGPAINVRPRPVGSPSPPTSPSVSPRALEAGVVSPRVIDIAEKIAQLCLDLTPKQKKAAIEHARKISVPKKCACGVKLMGKFADTGVCSKCTSAQKKKPQCRICEKGLRGEYLATGLCAGCTKVQERKELKALKALQKELEKK